VSVSSNQVYGVLRERLAAPMKDAGYVRLKSGRLGWFLPHGELFIVVQFAVSSFGWSTPFGSQFTLDFDLLDAPSAHNGPHLRRFVSLLGAEDREHVRTLNNRVAASLPGPRPGDVLYSLPQEQLDEMRRLSAPRSEPYYPGQDVWMLYHGLPDVAAWAEFLEPRMLSMAADYASVLRAGGS
jgi:hypothetical protein